MKNTKKNPVFRKTNLQWIVEYDYDRTNCHCGYDICRCTEIINAHVDNVDVKEIIKRLDIAHTRSDVRIDAYCFDRICYAFKIYDKDLYEIEIGGGYYGEEVYGVWFENEEKIFNAYCELLALNTDLEKIQYCLKLEYGYLIDCVELASSADIINVSPKKIHTPQMEYFKRVDREIINAYKDRNLPIAVCVKDGDQYRLIDGYHRFVANKDKNEIEIIVLE